MKNFNKFENVILVPFYEDKASLEFLLDDLKVIYKNNFYIFIVDDGSLNHKLNEENLQNSKINGSILRLKRNVGHQKAIAIGIRHIAQDILDNQKIIIMDCDGEDLPKTSSVLLDQINDESIDIVVAKRKKRKETFVFKSFYLVYKIIFLFLTGRTIDFGNYMVLKKTALIRLSLMPELSTHIAATVVASKLRIKKIPLNRGARYAGKSKMNFFSLVLHGFRALMVFTEEVLVRVGIICIIIAAFSGISSIIAITLKLLGFSSPGWFSIALGILLLIMIQTGTLALTLLISVGKNNDENIDVIKSSADMVEEIFET